MNRNELVDVEQFIADIDLTGVPTYRKRNFAAQPPRFIPTLGEEQSVVVGSQLQAFAKNVDETTRKAIQNSVLLAQLAAQKKALPDDYDNWYQIYFEVLSHIGWLIQERSFNSFDSGGSQADVHRLYFSLLQV